MHSVECEVEIEAPVEAVFDVLRDIQAWASDLPAFQRVEITEETNDSFIATMHEHYGGRDVTIVSRFGGERPTKLSYEHLDGPYGENRGTFTLRPHERGTTLNQVHMTEQNLSDDASLREQWQGLMRDQLEAIKRAAEGRK